MGVLVLDYGDVHHRDHGGVTVGEDFDIGCWFARLVLVLLYDLSYAGEVGCGACVLHSSLEHLRGRTDEFVCFGVQWLLPLAQRLKFAKDLRFLYARFLLGFCHCE